ncbi:DNA ligase [Thiocystis violacea]|uniref:DNA ligase n=1 Tax=Thiocystis violacea TaxID=13725 RepID=UPI001903067F|nr:DNA ligase [Thiocystis violacea]MBK1721470.1 DNA ligase [Thiocystis violacea]
MPYAASALAPSGQGGEAPAWSADASLRGASTSGDSVEVPDLMLAEVYEPGVDLADYWVSEKLDGVRAYWDGARLVSRGGIRIHAPAWFTAGFPARALDGELWIERGAFERVSGAVRRREPDLRDWRAIRYRVFDLPSVDATFGERLPILADLVATASNPYLSAVEQVRIRDAWDLRRMLREVEAAGGEGLMLHRDDARYRGGRSSALLKVKSHQDADARVIARIPGRGRLAGMLGSLLVEDEDGRRFRIGTGFSDAERRNAPPVGSIVTFTYQGRTERGIPRFASFLRVREDD